MKPNSFVPRSPGKSGRDFFSSPSSPDQEYRPEEILSGLQHHPEDLEAYMLLGDAYLSSGNINRAKCLYQRALALDPANSDVQHRIKSIHQTMTPGTQSESEVPSDPAKIAKILQEMTGRREPIRQQDLEDAARILNEMVRSEKPAEVVSNNLIQIDTLLPSLLEINIRQAISDGRPDLAEALQNLLTNITLQLDNVISHPGGLAPGSNPGIRRQADSIQKARILFLAPESESSGPRHAQIAAGLQNQGIEASSAVDISRAEIRNYDLVVAHNPHISSNIMSALATCSAFKIPIIVDLDLDFESMPVNHFKYGTCGIGSRASAKAFSTALLLADLLTVPSEMQAHSFRSAGNNVRVIPDGWPQTNKFWDKKPPRRDTFNLGWMDYSGQLLDLTLIRRILLDILSDFPHTRIVLGGDPSVCQYFDEIEESRRIFIPAPRYEDMPFLLGQVDLLLIPLRNTPFNHTLPDRPLLEAGIRRIPWIASPIESFTAWGAGGLIARDELSWHTYVRQMILDPNLYQALGQSGREKAEEREVTSILPLWNDVLEQALRIPFHDQTQHAAA
jgi:tetratricopeptide (TPR) repeat protein